MNERVRVMTSEERREWNEERGIFDFESGESARIGYITGRLDTWVVIADEEGVTIFPRGQDNDEWYLFCDSPGLYNFAATTKLADEVINLSDDESLEDGVDFVQRLTRDMGFVVDMGVEGMGDY